MTILTKFGVSMVEVSFDNPTTDQVAEAINELDGVNRLGIGIQLGTISKYLDINVSKQKFRMHIRYSVKNERGTLASSRIIIDSNQESTEELSFLLSNGQVDTIPIHETVTRQSALDIALYFLEHGEMPNGFTWDPPILNRL